VNEHGLEPGVLTGDSGKVYLIGEPIGLAPEPGSVCDAESATILTMPDGSTQCRCVVCPRCRHHTGNAHQGHHWGFCKVTGTVREGHFCCPDPAFGCELEVMP